MPNCFAPFSPPPTLSFTPSFCYFSIYPNDFPFSFLPPFLLPTFSSPPTYVVVPTHLLSSLNCSAELSRFCGFRNFHTLVLSSTYYVLRECRYCSHGTCWGVIVISKSERGWMGAGGWEGEWGWGWGRKRRGRWMKG